MEPLDQRVQEAAYGQSAMVEKKGVDYNLALFLLIQQLLICITILDRRQIIPRGGKVGGNLAITIFKFKIK